MRVLVVDDEAEVGEILLKALGAAGYDTAYAPNGGDAMRSVTSRGADIVIVDMHMPGMDGLEFIARLRRLRPRTKIIGISGGDSGTDVDMLKMSGRLGAHATLAKPFTTGELVDKIKALAPEA
jgi:two-component system response regulator RegX3